MTEWAEFNVSNMQSRHTGLPLHCVQKKTPTHVFFYISVENVSICTKFSGYVCEELGILSTLNLIFIAFKFLLSTVVPCNVLFTNLSIWRQNYVTGSKEYLIFMSAEYLITHKYTLKILCKSKHFPLRYKRNHEWVFFSEHSVDRHTDPMKI